MDYLFFDHVNQSLWKQIQREGEDFWEELKFFRKVKKKVTNFCQEALIKMAVRTTQPTILKYEGGKGKFFHTGRKELFQSFLDQLNDSGTFGRFYSEQVKAFLSRVHMQRKYPASSGRPIGVQRLLERPRLWIPASKWSPGFEFDTERCMGMFFNPLVFKNLLRVKQHPHLCQALDNIPTPPPPKIRKKPRTRLQKRVAKRRHWTISLETFSPRNKRQAVFHPAYCSYPRDIHNFAKAILSDRDAYGFSYVHRG